MMPQLSAQTKAIAAAIVAFLLQVQVFVGQGGVDVLLDVTLGQWITIVVGTLGAYGVVYQVPNNPQPAHLDNGAAVVVVDVDDPQV